MNSLLLLGARNAHVRRVRILKCLYCRRVFSNFQALGGHLRTHRAEIRSRRNSRYPVNSFNILNISGNNLSQLARSELENSFGILSGISPFPFRENLPAGINGSICPCPRETGMFNAGNFGYANPYPFVPPNHSVVSDGAQVHPSNLMFSASISSPVNGGSSNACAPPTAAGFVSVRVVCHDRTGRPNPASATTDTHSAPSLNQSPGFNNSTYGFVPQGMAETHNAPSLSQSPGFNNPTYGFVPQGMAENEDDLSDDDNANSDLSEEENANSFEGNRSFSVGVFEDGNMMSASEEPKPSFHPMVQSEEPQPRELLLFKDPKLPFPGPENFGGGEAAVQHLDLSLCL